MERKGEERRGGERGIRAKQGLIRGEAITMANIAVQRIKREFKEVLKSEEVCHFILLCHPALRVSKGNSHVVKLTG